MSQEKERLQNDLDKADWKYLRRASDLARDRAVEMIDQATYDSEMSIASTTRRDEKADARKDHAVNVAGALLARETAVTEEDKEPAEDKRDAVAGRC